MKKLPPLKEQLVRDCVDELASVPPPPDHDETKARVLERMPRARQTSGSWDVETLIKGMLDQQRKVAERQLAEVVQAYEAEKAASRARRKWVADVAGHVVSGIVLAAILYLLKLGGH